MEESINSCIVGTNIGKAMRTLTESKDSAPRQYRVYFFHIAVLHFVAQRENPSKQYPQVYCTPKTKQPLQSNATHSWVNEVFPHISRVDDMYVTHTPTVHAASSKATLFLLTRRMNIVSLPKRHWLYCHWLYCVTHDVLCEAPKLSACRRNWRL